MIKTRTLLLLLAGIMVFLNAMDVSAFGDESFRRQQSQADDGFNELDEEFAEPEAVKPPRPKVIIKEKIIIKEILVPVPMPVEKTPVPFTRPSASEKIVDVRGYQFTLEGCTLSGRNIECNLTVVRTEDDAKLTLYPNHGSRKTSIFNNVGNQYISNSTSLGSSENARRLSLRLIRGISTRMKIYFNNVSSETESIAALEVSAHDGAGGKHFKVQFRDVLLIGKKMMPISSPLEKAPERKPSASVRRVSLHGLDFTLRGCILASRKINCDFTVISPNDDKELSLYASVNHWTSFFDNIGDQYFSNLVVFGNKEGSRSVNRRLIQGIAVPIKLNFDNVSSETSSIALLEFTGNAAGKQFTLKFRDIPLS